MKKIKYEDFNESSKVEFRADDSYKTESTVKLEQDDHVDLDEHYDPY
jgi:hypothetical protein